MRPLSFSFACLLALAPLSCRKKDSPQAEAPARREHPLVQDGTVARAITAVPDKVKVIVDLGAVRGAIRAYGTEHNGSFPASLEDVPLEGRLNYPKDLEYDAATGTVRSRSYPDD